MKLEIRNMERVTEVSKGRLIMEKHPDYYRITDTTDDDHIFFMGRHHIFISEITNKRFMCWVETKNQINDHGMFIEISDIHDIDKFIHIITNMRVNKII